MIDDPAVVSIIDRDESFRERLQVLFEAVGLTVDLFESAEEYLQMRNSHLPYCTVLDVRLPGISGLDLQSRLTKSKRTTSLVFLTAYEDVRTSVRAMKAGAIDFLTRPFQEEELLDAVRNGIKRDRAHREESQLLEEHRTRLSALSPREREIMVLLSKGQRPKQIADQMKICTHTARVHSSRVLAKMGARSIADLVRIADKIGYPEKAEAIQPIEMKGFGERDSDLRSFGRRNLARTTTIFNPTR
jgi:FixJ family two-component response regulator